MFYQTIPLTSAELKKAVRDAKKQEEAIYTLFEKSGGCYSPSQVTQLMERAGRVWPITSVRRAMTDLTDAGKLEKTEETVRGQWGKPEYKWKLKKAI